MMRFALVSLVPVLLLGWGLSREIRATVEARALDSFASSAEATMQLVATAFLADGVGPETLERVDELANEIKQSFDLEARFRLVLPNGLVVYASEGSSGLTSLPADAASALAGNATGTFTSKRPSWLRSDARPFVIWVPVHSGTQTLGALEMVGASGQLSGGLDHDVRRIQFGLLIGLATLWLVLLPIVARVARRLERQADDNRRLAELDPLTGLANRNVLRDRLEGALDDAGRGGTGLLLIDLDDFKEVNDTLGHSNGDSLLVHVGRVIRRCTREDDTVARLGGDEFAVVVGAATDEGLDDLADRILRELRQPVLVDGVDVDVDASIGIALSPDDGETAELLLQHSDIAMYAAKESRLGRCRYEPDIDLHSPTRLALASELKRGLDRGELELHYQPIAAAATREIESVEALVRWRHPSRGLLPPLEFLPLAERTGLIHRLTLNVFDLALRQQRSWLDAGIAVTVSVNLSAADLRSVALVDRVKSLLEQHRVPPELVQVELTEQGLLQDPDAALLVLARLRGLGVQIALDDFGVGSSSLSYLRSIRADVLKIDRSFICDLEESDTNTSIVRALVDLAHVLGMEVTAEGVETDGQWARLAELGCDQVQGFHLSRPLPADEATALLRRAPRVRSGVSAA
jgi:diguanylate cyclase (GGDEF)-like protein